MDFAISLLEYDAGLRQDWMTDPESEDYARLKSQVDEINAAIAILKHHSAKVPATPPGLVRDYPHSSD
jgi:Ni,Fe-hydrogenase III large subunit